MPTRRDLLRSAALVPAAALPLSLATIDAALAQAIDLLKLFVPARPAAVGIKRRAPSSRCCGQRAP
jgi:hypothetical protein